MREGTDAAAASPASIWAESAAISSRSARRLSSTGPFVVATHGQLEPFVRAVSRPAERPEVPAPQGPPTPEQVEALAAIAREHGIELPGPPLDA